MIEECEFDLAARVLGLRLHYQPIVCCFTGRVMGAEALARLPSEDGALVSGAAMVHEIERIGNGPLLDRWAVRNAVAAAEAWRSEGFIVPVHVNVGASALCPQAAEQFYLWLRKLPIDYSLLTLEITETQQISDYACAAQLVRACRELGLEVAIDDFGCGYSTLELLQKIRTDVIKIDCRFTQRIVADPRTAAIVRYAIDLAHTLGCSVVAEGVEDTATWRWLEEAGCDLMQGYLIERALPEDEFARWHHAWARFPPRPAEHCS